MRAQNESRRRFDARLETLERRVLLAADWGFHAVASTNFGAEATTASYGYLATTTTTTPTTGEIFDDEIADSSPADALGIPVRDGLSIEGTNRAGAKDFVQVEYINGGAQIQFTLQLRDLNDDVIAENIEVIDAPENPSARIFFDGNAGDDVFVNLTDLGSTVNGGTGDDVIRGGAGVDFLFGNEGDDLILGAGGNDRLFGGAGVDELRGSDGDDEIQGGAGNDRLYGDSGDDLLGGDGGVDSLLGGDGDDTLLGGSGGDALLGQEGNDTLLGGSGGDVLLGGSGDDLLRGQSGLDFLYGEAGDDRLDGGADGELDQLHGGDGADVFADHSARWWEFWKVGEVDSNLDLDRSEGDRFGRF